MNVWLRTGRSVKVLGALGLGATLTLLTVPVAIALEGPTASTDTLGSDSLDESEPALEPSPTDTSLTTEPVTDSTAEEVTDPVAEETGVIDDTLDTVAEADGSGTLSTTTDPVREVLSPSEEPTGGTEGEGAEGDGDGSEQPTDDASGGAPAGDDGGQDATSQDGAGQDAPASEKAAAASGPLRAQPAARGDVRRPVDPRTSRGPGLSEADQASAADLMGKLTAIDRSVEPEPLSPIVLPDFLRADPHAAEVVVPLGPRSTRDILDAMGPAAGFAGTVARTLAPFPVAGPATYSDDFGAPRHVPSFHDHAGTDVFAPRGTPVIASADGTIGSMGIDTAIGGNSLKLFTADGTYFYYAHLDGFAAGIGDGASVQLGQVLGFVGDTGNALGTPPHLHYEIHPAGGAPVNPVPYLDRWLANARAAAQSLAGASQGVWTPQVAAPADAGAATASDATQAAPAPVPGAAAAQLDPSLTGVDGGTSPLALLVIVGSVGVLFLMLRRPQTVSSPPTVPARSVDAAPAVAPQRPAAALIPLSLPGEQVEPAEPVEEFQWITVGA